MGSRLNGQEKNPLTTFFFILKTIILLEKGSTEGPKFSSGGGGQLFPGEGDPNAIFYRNL